MLTKEVKDLLLSVINDEKEIVELPIVKTKEVITFIKKHLSYREGEFDLNKWHWDFWQTFYNDKDETFCFSGSNHYDHYVFCKESK